MWRRMAGWVAGCLLVAGGPAVAGGVSRTGGWVVDGVSQWDAGGGAVGPVSAQSVAYANETYPNLQAAIDALFAAMSTNAGETNATVSQEYGQYVLAGLHDNRGTGTVTMACFNADAQLWHGLKGLPEAGSSLVATLLDGRVKEHYKPSKLIMTGVSGLGWAQYDLFFYGFTGTVRCWIGAVEVSPQTCNGFDPLNLAHRTQFIAGVNYVKFAGLYGDSLRIEFPEWEFCGVQIVKSGSGGNPEGLGVRWTGGGALLAPTNALGAEVPCGGWYNIDPDGVIHH